MLFRSAAMGVPARFSDPNAPAPPKVPKQETKPVEKLLPVAGGGAMAPPPLPQMPQMSSTPTPMGGQVPQTIMTPNLFATHNLAQRTATLPSASGQAPNALKQNSPSMPKSNTLSGPSSTMQGSKFMGQPQPQAQAQIMQRNQFSPPILAPDVTAKLQMPVAGLAASVAPIASTVATVAPIIATSAPLPLAAPVTATAAPVPDVAIPAPAPAQPTA